MKMSDRDFRSPTDNVFVYGTLKEGFSNHHILKNSEFLGRDRTVGFHSMISLGGFPGVIWGGGTGYIFGEVYRVTDPNVKVALDNLEGYPDFYDKARVWTFFGPCDMYVLSDGFLAGGDYRKMEPMKRGEWLHAS